MVIAAGLLRTISVEVFRGLTTATFTETLALEAA
jgi:hypothetical protein